MVKKHMRKAPNWLTQADERILELLVDSDPLPATAIRDKLAAISPATDYSRAHISRRCGTLSKNDLLERRYRNYSISEQGEAYLTGER